MSRTPRRISSALGKLISGSVFGYGLVLLLSPVLTRLYSPTEFGTFAVFGAFVAISSIFMAFSLELGILSVRSKGGAINFGIAATAVAILIGLGLTTALTLYILLGGSLPLPAWSLYLAVSSCFMAVMTSIGVNWSIRSENPGIAARATFTSLAGRSGMQAGLGIGPGGLEGLVIGEVLGRLLGWMMSEQGIFKLALTKMRRTPLAILKLVERHKSYPLLVTPGMAIDSALVWLPAPLFALMFDPLVGGFIALIQRLGSAPLTIANQSVVQLFHREASRILGTQNHRILRSVLKAVFATLPLLAGIGFLLWLYGENLAIAAFGAHWAGAEYVALILLPLYYVQLISLLTNRLILIMGMMRLKFLGSVLHLIILLITIFGGALAGLSWKAALVAFSVSLCVSHSLVIGIALMATARWTLVR
jgi:O-antigen/teichoic acid export membrane protein